MASISVDISPNVIAWVIRQSENNNVPMKTLEMLNSWYSGEKKPTFSQVEDVSQKTRIPFGFFFMSTPPEEFPLAEFRTVGSKKFDQPSRDYIDTVHSMEDVQEWMEDYRKREDCDPLSYVGICREASDGLEVARKIRNILQLDLDWYKISKSAADSFSLLRQRMSDNGVIVMMNGVVGSNTRRKLNINEFRAFTLINAYAPLIFINACDTHNARLFSLLHEFAHVLLGKDNLYNDSYRQNSLVSRAEAICNAAAAEILIPKEHLIESWSAIESDNSLEKVRGIAKEYKCSAFVAARRLRDLSLVSYDGYAAILKCLNEEFINSDEKKSGGGGDYYRTLQSRWDKGFIRSLNESARAGDTSYTEVFRLTGTNEKTFDKLVSTIGETAV